MAKSQNKTQEIIAAVCRPDGSFAFERLVIDPPRNDEVLIRLIASGICHTDLDFYNAAGSPVILGHEGAGVVEQVGLEVKNVQKGDHVVMSYSYCGDCAACIENHPANCEHFMDLNFGFQRLDGSSAYSHAKVKGHFFGQSSFASYSVTGAHNLVKVDKSLPLETLAALGCGLQTGAGTVFNSLDVQAEQSVAVFGVGSVGLAAVMAASLRGAHPIIAVDIRPQRLKLARELGASHSINTSDMDRSEEKLAEQLPSFSGDGLDAIVESTGSSSLMHTGLDCLKKSGAMALLTGAGSTDARAFEVIQGDAIPQQFIPELIQLWRQGKFSFDRLITRYDFSDINKAMAEMEAGSTIKPVLVFENESEPETFEFKNRKEK